MTPMRNFLQDITSKAQTETLLELTKQSIWPWSDPPKTRTQLDYEARLKEEEQLRDQMAELERSKWMGRNIRPVLTGAQLAATALPAGYGLTQLARASRQTGDIKNFLRTGKQLGLASKLKNVRIPPSTSKNIANLLRRGKKGILLSLLVGAPLALGLQKIKGYLPNEEEQLRLAGNLMDKRQMASKVTKRLNSLLSGNVPEENTLKQVNQVRLAPPKTYVPRYDDLSYY